MTGAVEQGAAALRVALEVLARVEDDGAYANLVLSPVLERSGLGPTDRGFVTDLVYGTLRRQRSLDHLVDRFLTSPPPPAARRVLRLGAYQLVFRDDIPTYAAVSATVDAAPKRFRGLVNAVLRKVDGAPVQYPDDATALSYPDWVVARLRDDLGIEDADAALTAMNQVFTAPPSELSHMLGTGDLVTSTRAMLLMDRVSRLVMREPAVAELEALGME